MYPGANHIPIHGLLLFSILLFSGAPEEEGSGDTDAGFPGKHPGSRHLPGAPGERTFYRVKVPNAPGSGKRQPKSRVSAARRNLKEDGGKTLA